MKTIFSIFLLLLTASVSLRASDPSVVFEKDVVYGKSGGRDLKLDLARPADGKGPFPVVVCYHGGGWQLGNKAIYDGLIQDFARKGYVAATVEYRLTPQFRFPAQVEDAKCAIRFLRAHAAQYRINKSQVAAMGDSAGGHLSLMMGLTEKSDGLEGDGGWEKESSKANLVINYYGPTDFASWHLDPKSEPDIVKAYGKSSDDVLAAFAGTSDRADKAMIRVSPITYIDPKDPPVLTFQGTADPLVRIDQCRTLHARLKSAGVEEELVLLEGAGHGWSGKLREQTTAKTFEFLEKHFGRDQSGRR